MLMRCTVRVSCIMTEKALINPLARHIFDDAIQAGEARVVTDIVKKDSGYDLVLS